ncbi:MAG: LytTR family transcriptional regulator DNA-binding domain-containing protein [Alistipes sp.]|nr:LytTR family transcriptional regulator DNA-binding domain-containing protein [Alistipes sp.]
MKNIYLHLNSRDEYLRIDVSKIVYFESDGNYTNIVLKNQLKGVICMNLTHMQQVLSERLKDQASIFARVGKKYIVNLAYLYQIQVQRQKLILSDGEQFAFTLDISKDALKNLKELYIGQSR